MSLQSFNQALRRAVTADHNLLRQHFKATVIFWYGPLITELLSLFRDFIEEEKEKCSNAADGKLVMVLHTPGGVAEAVEKMVEVIRQHFTDVTFVVPDYAMSAGTLLCMSGDRILMDYSSSLGPVDPQVPDKDGQLIPAMGYLDEVGKFKQKASLSEAEVFMLQQLDIGMLNAYESARDLTVTLLKEWLVRYKFKTWETHRTDPDKIGQNVTLEEKEARAEELARMLADNQLWKSHGRFIGMARLRKQVRLEVEDFGEVPGLRSKVRSYHDTLVQMVEREKQPFFLHGVTTWAGTSEPPPAGG